MKFAPKGSDRRLAGTRTVVLGKRTADGRCVFDADIEPTREEGAVHPRGRMLRDSDVKEQIDGHRLVPLGVGEGGKEQETVRRLGLDAGRRGALDIDTDQCPGSVELTECDVGESADLVTVEEGEV